MPPDDQFETGGITPSVAALTAPLQNGYGWRCGAVELDPVAAIADYGLVDRGHASSRADTPRKFTDSEPAPSRSDPIGWRARI